MTFGKKAWRQVGKAVISVCNHPKRQLQKATLSSRSGREVTRSPGAPASWNLSFLHRLKAEDWHCPGLLGWKSCLNLDVLPPRWAVTCSVRPMTWDLSSQRALSVPLVCTSLLPGSRKLFFLHIVAKVMLLQPQSDCTVTDPSCDFPSQVITKPKGPLRSGPCYIHLLPFPSFPLLLLLRPHWLLPGPWTQQAHSQEGLLTCCQLNDWAHHMFMYLFIKHLP